MTAAGGLSGDSFHSVERIIQSNLGTNRSIATAKRVSGGCIADAFQMVLDDGTSLFAKVSSGQGDDLRAEASGLEALRATNTIAVPTIVAGQTDNSTSILVMEWIESSLPKKEFWSRFGQKIAQLHLANDSIGQFGFFQNNFIGSNDQINHWKDQWPEFFAEFRLAFQGDLALKRHLIDTSQRKQIDRLIEKLSTLFKSSEMSPALLHGDLWSGNFLCDANQTPVIFDPAVYFGHHECEFGITTLFGGFDSTFYEAYHEVIPRDDGTSERIEIYQLYHLLNHLNLFGQSYWSACQAILSKYS
jgi:fructosamine-3-kinase